MPEIFQEFSRGWQRLHPNWRLILWGQAKELPPLVNRDLYDRASEICPGYEGQLRSDIVRYELLYQYGGVWIDTDFECLKPIDGLLDGVECFLAWNNPGKWLNNAIMGAEARHPFMERLIEGLPESVAAHPGKMPRVITGPQYLTPMWREDPDGITIFDKPLFYPYLWNQLKHGTSKFPDAYGVHHWYNRRRERGIPLERRR